MTSDDYNPISCASHSEYELAIMHKQTLLLKYDGISEEVVPIDILTRDKAEYLLVSDSNDAQKEIRLDKITEALCKK